MITLHPVFIGAVKGEQLASTITGYVRVSYAHASKVPVTWLNAVVEGDISAEASAGKKGDMVAVLVMDNRVTATATHVVHADLRSDVINRAHAAGIADVLLSIDAQIVNRITTYAHAHGEHDILAVVDGSIGVYGDASQIVWARMSADVTNHVDVACDLHSADVGQLVANVAGSMILRAAGTVIPITRFIADIIVANDISAAAQQIDSTYRKEEKLVGSVSDSRIVMARASRPRHVWEKRAGDTVRYAIDWRPWLRSDSVAASDWIVYSNDLHIVAQDVVGRVTRVAIGGGSPDTVYPVTNRVTTDGGQVITRSVHLYVLPTIH